MAFNATTLSAAIGAKDTTFAVASATGITAPNFTTGVGITYLLVETEVMIVLGVSSTTLSVQRGVAGTPTAAHASGAIVLAGLPADFSVIVPAVKASQDPTPNGVLYGFSAAVASSATIVASGPLFHVTGTGPVNIITPYAGFIEGQVTIVFDSVCPWTSSNVTNGISATGTNTTAGSAVTFTLDAATNRWYPSRLA